MADRNNQINFISPETASRIRELAGAPTQDPSQPRNQNGKGLFYQIRRVKLLFNPVWDNNNNTWTSYASFKEDLKNAQTTQPIQIPVVFEQDTAPHCSEGDEIYVVFKGGVTPWAALLPDPIPMVGRILTYSSEAPNRWRYKIQLITFTQTQAHSYIPILEYESAPDALNLCEVENLETGLMGNGIDLNGFAPDQTTKSFTAPVPPGTMVFVFGYNYWDGDQQKKVYAFQFQNQLAFPFSSHLFETTPASLTGPSESGQTPDNNHLTMSINGEDQKVYCPLLRSGETLPKGTKVILSQNIKTGFWEIIEAQCDSASAAALPEEDEGAEPIAPDDPPLDDLEDVPAADSGEDGETGGTEGGE